MADGRHIAEYWKRYNSPIKGPIWMKLGWSHPITFSTCRPWCGCHGNGRCLATAHWTFSSYGRLEAERILMKFGTQQQVRTTMTVKWSNITFLKFKMADGRHVGNIENAITRLPMDRLGRNLGGRIQPTPKTFSLVLIATAYRTVNVRYRQTDGSATSINRT